MAEHNGFEWLARLPDVDPPATLWPRIEAARRQRSRGRLLAPALAASIALIGFALALVATQAPPAPAVAGLDGLDGLIEDNRRLVESLQTYQTSAGALAGWQEQRIRSLEIDLSLLDRKLQEGYSFASDSRDLETLWRTRAGLLSSLIETYERPRDIRRI